MCACVYVCRAPFEQYHSVTYLICVDSNMLYQFKYFLCGFSEKGNSQRTLPTVFASEAAEKELPVDKTRTQTQRTKQTVLISCNKIDSILPGAVRERMTKYHCLVLISCLIVFASVITMKGLRPTMVKFTYY